MTNRLDVHGLFPRFDLVGKEVGVSRWITLDQQRITDFGRITEDEDPMHVDPQWAASHSPYESTISFGFLTLSMLTTMINELIARPADEVASLNYGFDKIRMLSPVRAGKRVRGHLVLAELELRKPDQFRSRYQVTVEVEGEDKPALYAEWLTLTNVREPRVPA